MIVNQYLVGDLGDLGVLIFLVALIGDIGVGRRRMRSGPDEPRPGLASAAMPQHSNGSGARRTAPLEGVYGPAHEHEEDHQREHRLANR